MIEIAFVDDEPYLRYSTVLIGSDRLAISVLLLQPTKRNLPGGNGNGDFERLDH